MNALLRKISPYTAPDILLGVFFTEADAQRARGIYLAQCPDDPWYEQAYRSTGLEAGHVQIVPLESPCSLQDGDEVFVVSNYEEMFGQVLRNLDSVHPSESAARSRMAEIDKADSTVPSHALLQRIRVGAMHSDRPDQQPHL